MLTRLKKQIFAEPDDTLKKYRLLLRRYWKWDMVGTVMFFLLVPPIAYLWFMTLVRMANWRYRLLTQDADYVLTPPPSYGPSALFFAIPIALVIVAAFLKCMLGDHYAELLEYSRMVGRYSIKGACILVGIFTFIFVIITFFAMNDYVRATQTQLFIRRFGSLRAEPYAYEGILSIQKSIQVKNRSGERVVLKQPAYVVKFSNGRSWNTIWNEMGRKPGELDSFIEYLSRRSQRPVEVVPYLLP